MVNQGGQSLFSLMVSWFKNITFLLHLLISLLSTILLPSFIFGGQFDSKMMHYLSKKLP